MDDHLKIEVKGLSGVEESITLVFYVLCVIAVILMGMVAVGVS